MSYARAPRLLPTRIKVSPLRTVHAALHKGGARTLALLDDPLLPVATSEIKSAGRQRHVVQQDIRAKERARNSLARKYASADAPEELLLQCMYSIGDNNSFLAGTRDPLDAMLDYLDEYFRPDAVEPHFSLSIQVGTNGARLSHSHERQYNYVKQSLTLWREIMNDMFQLWYVSDQDLLREGGHYRLCDTGQGLNRLQNCPNVSRVIHGILDRCQRKLGGSWVGSSVVHLGDSNVPNGRPDVLSAGG